MEARTAPPLAESARSALVGGTPRATQDEHTACGSLSARRQVRGWARERQQRRIDSRVYGRSTDLIRTQSWIEVVEGQGNPVSMTTFLAMPDFMTSRGAAIMDRGLHLMGAQMRRRERGRTDADDTGCDDRGGNQTAHFVLPVSCSQPSATAATATAVSAGAGEANPTAEAMPAAEAAPAAEAM